MQLAQARRGVGTDGVRLQHRTQYGRWPLLRYPAPRIGMTITASISCTLARSKSTYDVGTP